jgi:pyrroline-5-carboxylate reductase
MLGVKPQKLAEVAPVVAPVLDPQTILISILAGAEQATLRALFPTPRTIIRAMPNTPVRLGKGVVILHGDRRDEGVTALMAALGHAEWFDEEPSFALAGHLTGAGPAFLFRFIEALAFAAETLGLPADKAARLATAMVEGAGALAASSAEGPVELARRVASPGGTTEAGLKVLDSEEALRRLVLSTLDASRRRGIELAEMASRERMG